MLSSLAADASTALTEVWHAPCSFRARTTREDAMLPDRFTIIPRAPRPLPVPVMAAPATPWRPAPPARAPLVGSAVQAPPIQAAPIQAPPAAAETPPRMAAPQPPSPAPGAAAPLDGGPPLGPDEAAPVPGEMTFAQFMEGLNPLHHLPVVGSIYRVVTGAEIHPFMRVLGGGVLGGPIGMILGAIGAAFEMTQPLQRLGHTLAGRPDPWLTPPQPDPTLGDAPRRAAAAYARHGEAG